MNGIEGTEGVEAGEGVPRGGRRAIVLLAAAGAALVLANAWRYAPYVQDDSYISLRYAKNLVEGHGLVFNPGERVEGYTNLLYVLFSAVFIRLGLDPILGLKVLGVAAALATLLLAGRLERRVGGGARSSLPLSVLLLAPLEAFVYWTFCPLETALYALLLLAGLLALLARRQPLAVALFFLLSLTRPEGPFLFAVATLGVFLVDAKAEGTRSALRRHVPSAVALALLLVPLFLWRHAYYGAWLPNTFYAKVTGGKGAFFSGLAYLRDATLALPLALLAALVAFARGLRCLSREGAGESFVLALLVVAQLLYAAAVGGDAMPFFRFVFPVLPLACVLLAGEIGRLRTPAFVAAAVALHWGISLLTVQPYRAFVADRTGAAGAKVGAWLKARLPKGTWVAVNTAGSLPYVSELPSIDTLGLNDAAIARRPVFIDSPGWAGHRRGWGEYVLSRRPAVILFYNASGSRDPYYLGDHELADDYRFRFFYRPRRARLPADRSGRRLARFFGLPFGFSASGSAEMLDLGIVAHFSRGLVSSTLLTEGDLVADTFERDVKDDALVEGVRDPAGPGRLLARAAEAWSREMATRPAPDPKERVNVEALCDEAYRRVSSGDARGASEILAAAVEANENARVSRVYQYLANIAVMAGDLFTAASAEKEALRLEPTSALFRKNLEHLLTVPYKTWKERAVPRPKGGFPP